MGDGRPSPTIARSPSSEVATQHQRGAGIVAGVRIIALAAADFAEPEARIEAPGRHIAFVHLEKQRRDRRRPTSRRRWTSSSLRGEPVPAMRTARPRSRGFRPDRRRAATSRSRQAASPTWRDRQRRCARSAAARTPPRSSRAGTPRRAAPQTASASCAPAGDTAGAARPSSQSSQATGRSGSREESSPRQNTRLLRLRIGLAQVERLHGDRRHRASRRRAAPPRRCRAPAPRSPAAAGARCRARPPR